MSFLAHDFGHIDSTTLPRVVVRAGVHIGKEVAMRAFVPVVKQTAGFVVKEVIKAILSRR
jgi:hypothetical protein